ncbi:phytanoyl-CoA dioxygenase family protein [Chenggangzhangella methanolivorans]
MLSDDQFERFARDGYLQVPGAVAKSTCDHLRRMAWRRLPEHWVRGEPETWTGLVTDSCHTESLGFRRGLLKFQKGELPTDDLANATFGRKSPFEKMIASLIGRPTRPRYRGLYLIVPFQGSEDAARYALPHVEAHPVQIIATTYLQDVRPGGGGLLVWPGSHRDLYPAFESKVDFIARDSYREIMKRYRRLEPVELSGAAGDAILIHHRLLHAPSLNRRRRIRYALLCDYFLPNVGELARETPGDDPFEDFSPRFEAYRGRETEHDYRTVDPADLKGRAIEGGHYTAINKRDASRLIRTLKDGDIWITLADNDSLSGTNKVQPCGMSLAEQGLRVFSDGVELVSACRNDFIAKAPAGDLRALKIVGARQPLWLRVIRVSLPVRSSAVILDQPIEPEDEREFSVGAIGSGPT